MFRIKSSHQLLLAANYSDGHSAGDRFTVHHHVGLNAEVLLGSTRREAKTTKHLVEDQGNSVGVTNLRQFPQPLRVGRARDFSLSKITGKQNRVARRRLIRMEGLNRIYQNSR